MNKPCDNCTQNVLEAMLYDEVTCFLKCELFKLWRLSGGTDE